MVRKHKPPQPLQKRTSFFKVLIGDFSKQLRVQPAFVKELRGNLCNEATIRGPTGSTWSVAVEKDENGLFFRRGWQDFAEAHGLENGDFLVFLYDGKAHFDIKAYGTNCCEKEIVLAESRDREKPTPTTEKINPPVQPAATRRKRGRVKVDEKSDTSTMAEQGINDECFSFNSRSSCFTATWSNSRRYAMIIPRALVIEKELNAHGKMVLKDPSGKSWPVTLSMMVDCRAVITRGWTAFWRSNKVQTGDTLVFDFGSEPGNPLVHVHIFRSGIGAPPRRRPRHVAPKLKSS
ncbi:putative B3 domain-containing protein Os03g0621600 [Malania oleifera]|uniref:putative B3 domain-containing protein Os03g0621600 n=1 Tax=Malania oleifera TaxID=397392 RepID=UPI0025AE680D|nr:putative B3 domain-containing protein Os03g0621600 [Malania oleifera]